MGNKTLDEARKAMEATPEYKDYIKAKKGWQEACQALDEAEDAYDGVWWGWEIND